VTATKATRELFKILEADQRKVDADNDCITLLNFRSHEVEYIMKQRMRQYQERTGNKDCGIFPYIIFNIDNIK
jgi:hypothetical protein